MQARLLTGSILVLVVLAAWWWLDPASKPRPVSIDSMPEWDAQATTATNEIDDVLPRATELPVASLESEAVVEDGAAAEQEFFGTESLPEWFVRVDKGVLEVEVWLGSARLSGAHVLVGPKDRIDFSVDGQADSHEDARRGVTDENGLVRFASLPAGGVYAVRVSHGGIEAYVDTNPISTSSFSWRTVIHLGTGGVEGRVSHEDGSPWPRRWVRVSAGAPNGNSYWRYTRTDGAGNYRIGGLPECVAHVVLVFSAEYPDAKTASRRVRLAEGEWKQIDFPSSEPTVRWSGRLVSTTGVPLPVEATIHFENLDRGNLGAVRTAADGSFGIDVLPGLHRIERRTQKRTQVLDEFRLSDALEHDLIVPGTLVRGRVSYVGRSPNPSAETGKAQFWLHGVDSTSDGGQASRSGDLYWILGVEPGQYRLEASGRSIVGAPADGLPLAVHPGQSLVQLDVTIQDP